MAMGRGSAMAIIIFSALLVLAHTVVAKDFTVGDSQAWSFPPGTNTGYYDAWSANQTFTTGDNLIFTYTASAHDVQVVTPTEYSSCTMSQGKKYTSGKDVIPLTASGTYYYVCSFLTHCEQGMKMKVVVQGVAPPAPTPSLPTPPPSTATALSISPFTTAAATALASLIAAFLLQV